MRLATCAAVCAAVFSAPVLTRAATAPFYFADLQPLNDSGVSGRATFDFVDGLLRVIVEASGVEPGQVHPQHIHGFLDGTDGVVPPESARGDADSPQGTLLSVGEGAPFYGAILLPLEPFPEPAGSTVDFLETYTETEAVGLSEAFAAAAPDLADAISSFEDLRPLEKRVYVLHGAFVDGEYVATLPIAAGEIRPIPLPAGFWMGLSMLGGLGGAGWLSKRRRA